MTKTKQQLRAEAVERLTELDERGYWKLPVHVALCGRDVPNVDEERTIIADLLTDDCDTECYECSRLAELTAENSQLRVKVDESANGIDGETNGIAGGSPLVDDMPEGDAVAILRDWLDYKINRFDAEANAIILNTGADPGKLYEIADMVERDYVSREAYEDLRDEFVWETTFLHRIAKKCGTKDVPSLKAYVEQLEAKVDAQRDSNGTCPDAMGQSSAHSKAQSKTGSRLSQLFGILSDESCRQHADQGEREEVPDCESDSREKLEADANGYVMSWWQSDWVDSFAHANSMKRDIMRLLDRQANITSSEWCWSNLQLEEENKALKAKVDELTEQLESAHAKNRSLKAHIAKMQEGRHGWHVKYPELLKRSAELQAKVDELEADVSQAVEDTAERVTNDGEMYDNREKLEADVHNHIAISITPDKEDDGVLAPYATVLEWLDRQAAITERELIENARSDCDICGNDFRRQRDEMQAENAELQAKVDELTENYEASSRALEILTLDKAELQTSVAKMAKHQCPGYEPENHYCRYHHQDFELNHQTVSRLKRENAELKEENDELRAESEKRLEVVMSQREAIGDLRERLLKSTAAKDEMAALLYSKTEELSGKLRATEKKLRDKEASRDHWEKVAARHAGRIEELRRQLKAERDLAQSWPRYEDGCPVRVGDVVAFEVGTTAVEAIEFDADGYHLKDAPDGDWSTSIGEKPVKRPPLVAGDGKPIEVGQTLYGEDGKAWRIERVEHLNRKYPVIGACGGEERALKPEWLVHGRMAG